MKHIMLRAKIFSFFWKRAL